MSAKAIIRVKVTVASALLANATLMASVGWAQTRPMEGIEVPAQVAPRTDWSDPAAPQNQVDSVSQPTRYDLRSSIPDSRTGNENITTPQPLRERGGVLLDRLELIQTPGRSAPITR